MFQKVTSLFKTKKNQSNEPILLQPSESQGDVKQSKEEVFFDWLIDNINEITKELPKSNQTLLSLYKVLLTNKKIKDLNNIFDSCYQSHLVSGTLNGKEHIWIVIGISEHYEKSCDFIYQKSKKPNSKWIIDVQPLLDNQNEKPLILEYNTNSQYVPYGNKTILDVDEYFNSLTNLKNITLYQPYRYSRYSKLGSSKVEIYKPDYYFDADILMFLLDSDFINNKYNYLNVIKLELFKKIIDAVHHIKILRDIADDEIEFQQYIITLFRRNGKIDLMSQHYQIMFDD